MTRLTFRVLATTAVNSSATPPPPAPLPTMDSDFVVILAALLCALICVLGLIAVARCAWLRRFSSSGSTPPTLPPPAVANKGVKKKILRSLPKQTFSPDSAAQSSDCAICLTEFAPGDEIRVLPQCGHGFHVSCIDTWLGSHSSCPSCRQILAVTRCHKCGGLPSVASAPAAASSSDAGAEASEVRLKERQDRGANRFLP